MSDRQKPVLINRLVSLDFEEADARGESLSLLRPQAIDFYWKKKTEKQIKGEQEKHAVLSRQLDMWGVETEDLEPCDYSFHLKWRDRSGILHNHETDDWETLGGYSRFKSDYGEERALEILKHKFENERFGSGRLVLAFSTHKLRNLSRGGKNQWLLVGLLSVEETGQTDLF